MSDRATLTETLHEIRDETIITRYNSPDYPDLEFQTIADLEHKIAGFVIPKRKHGIVTDASQDKLLLNLNQAGTPYAVVMDGIGGYKDLEVLHDVLTITLEYVRSPQITRLPFETPEQMEEMVRKTHQKVRNLVRIHRGSKPHIKNSVSTILCAAFTPTRTVGSYSGDSPLYTKLALDHKSYQLTRAQKLPTGHLTSALGSSQFNPLTINAEFQGNNLVYGGSDGLDELLPEQFVRISQLFSPEECVQIMDGEWGIGKVQTNLFNLYLRGYMQENGIETLRDVHATNFTLYVLEKSLPRLAKMDRHDDITFFVYNPKVDLH